jgi:K+-sensing histidine kinase KdpD
LVHLKFCSEFQGASPKSPAEKAGLRDGDVITEFNGRTEDLPKIWERLYRGDKSRSQRGLGLRLSLVKAFVEAHGGRVEVRSEPGVFSEFTLHLSFPTP